MVKVEAHLHRMRCETSSDYGLLLRILPPVIVLLARLGMMEPQDGLTKTKHSDRGRRTALYCGFMATVRC
jgi:hypothetical protein